MEFGGSVARTATFSASRITQTHTKKNLSRSPGNITSPLWLNKDRVPDILNQMKLEETYLLKKHSELGNGEDASFL